jgi:Ca-activated chloride channel family protein
MGFARWEVLLALVPLFGAGAALWWSRRPSTRRASLAWGLTGLAVLLAVLGLAGPRIGRRPPVAVLAADGSASIGPHAASEQRALLRRVGGIDCRAPCRIIRFGANANASPANEGVTVDRTATDLQAGITAAIGLAPAGGQVVVLSDGAQTTGDLLADVPLAQARRVRVSWIRPERGDRRDAAITSLGLPAAVHSGDSVPVTLTVHSTTDGFALLRLRVDGSHTRSKTIRVVAGDNRLLLVYTAGRRGWHSFQASVRLRGDGDPRNNSLSAVTDVLAQPRVLAVAAPGSPVPRLLAKLGMRVRTVAPDRLPAGAAGYRGADALVLSDVPATSLGRSRVAALEDAVRAGGLGLLVLGGPHSFSLGRYAKSPLEQVLPVRSLMPGNLKRRNVAVELVLDRSGSMSDSAGGVPKITMTQQAARQTAAFATKHDAQLGIVDFDIVAQTLVPLQRFSSAQQRDRIDKTIDAMRADGGTDIYHGLNAGYAELSRSHAPQRHIILMTDGISDPEHYAPLLAKLRQARISVATVALGSDADRQLLARIAAATGGHAYVTDNARELPKIFAKETKVSAKPVRVHGRLAVSLSSDSPVVRSLLPGALPTVRGNVVVTVKQGAQADLVASGMKSTTDPALAEWQIGQGRVVAWTPGLGAPWGAAWLARKSLWNDAIRWAQRGAAAPATTPVATPGTADELEIDLSGAGVQALGVSAISGTLTDSAGHRRAVRFTPAGPATYAATPADLGPGVYSFSLASFGSSAVRATGEVAVPYSPEFSPNAASVSPLGELVRQTGGTIVGAAQADTVFARVYDLSRLLTLTALICFLAGVAVRLLPSRSRRPRAGIEDGLVARRRRSAASRSGRSREADRAGRR